eukprot:SM000026S08984  [mRNA]  locus=s26:888279:889125:- [translate_table: standard]
MFSSVGPAWQLRPPPGPVRRPRRAGLLCLPQLPPTSASSPSWRGPTPRRNGEERAETVLSSAEPLPLPMPYPDSRPLPKEAIDKILQCDPEVEKYTVREDVEAMSDNEESAL